MNDDDHASLLVMAMFPLLEDNQGVVVHSVGKGYVIFKTSPPSPQIKIIEDDDLLKLTDRQIIIVNEDKFNNDGDSPTNTWR